MLTRFGNEGPSVEEMRAGWSTDERTVVVLVDPSGEPRAAPRPAGSDDARRHKQAPGLLRAARLQPSPRNPCPRSRP